MEQCNRWFYTRRCGDFACGFGSGLNVPATVIYGRKSACPAASTPQGPWSDLEGLDRTSIDEVIVVRRDTDETREITRRLGVRYAFHRRNLAMAATRRPVMRWPWRRRRRRRHAAPDYQYDRDWFRLLACMVASGIYDVVVASRILGLGAVAAACPATVCGNRLTLARIC